MWITEKGYTENSNDFINMCRLISYLNKISNTVYDWSLGRIVDWKYGLWNNKKQEKDFCENTVRLWYSFTDELVGILISEEGNNEFQIIAKNGYEYLYNEMLESIINDPFDEGILEIICMEGDKAKHNALEKANFNCVDISETTHVYDASPAEMQEINIPDGFVIEDMNVRKEYDKQIELKRNAFQNGKHFSSSDFFAYRYVKRSPIYDPEMDLILINDKDEFIAGCEGFIDYESGLMEIERVCTHQEHRRRGYAKLVIQECINKGIERGIRKFHITGWNEMTNKLYSSFGDHVKERKVKFQKFTT